MKGSGLGDPEQQMHVAMHHLQDLQKPCMHESVDHCMPIKEKELTRLHGQVGGNRLEGEILILNRQQVFEEVASNRHGFLAETWRDPKRRESTAMKAFGEVLERPTHGSNLVGAKFAEEQSDEVMAPDLKLSINVCRACRICNKQFSSGRALGGHMRVHGALSRNYGSASAAANLMDKKDDDVPSDEEDHHGLASIIDASSLDGAAKLENASPLQHIARSAQAASSGYGELASSGHGALEMKLSDSNLNGCGASELDAADYADGDEDEDVKSIEGRFLSLGKDNSRVSYLEGARIDEANRVRRSLLYKLRYNPKRSRWFADKEFSFQASMANLSAENSRLLERVSACSECGKAFLSERALFGHMRCHPNRERRVGLSPDCVNSEQPVDSMARQCRKPKLLQVADINFIESSETQIGSKGAGQAEEDEASMETRKRVLHARLGIGMMNRKDLVEQRRVEDLLSEDKQQHGNDRMNDGVALATRWRSAGRRSRRKFGSSKTAGAMENKATSSSSPAEDEPALTSETISFELTGMEEQEIGTPDFLILLADAAKKIEEDAERLLIRKEKCSHLRGDTAKRLEHQQRDRKLHRKYESGGEEEDFVVLPAHDMGIGKYECTTCKKSFNSHQALGGHRASHKKTKGCFARTGSSEGSKEHSLEDELELCHVQELKGTVMNTQKKKRQAMPELGAFKGHACSICHRIFLTGQALGGHKRCHWTGEKQSEAAASIASTNYKQLSLQSEGQSVVEGGIDLNMPAPMDEEEDADLDEVGFAPAEILYSTNREIADEETELDHKINVGGSDLVLGTSALAWAVKDLLKDDMCTLPQPPPQQKESEIRRRFDGIWGQHWPNNGGVTDLHQPMYALESLT